MLIFTKTYQIQKWYFTVAGIRAFLSLLVKDTAKETSLSLSLIISGIIPIMDKPKALSF